MSPAHAVPEPEKTPEPPPDPAVLRAEIAVVREELGDTLEALSYRLDVKARASEKLAEVRTKAARRLGSTPVVAVLAGVAAVAIGLLTWHAVKGRKKR